MSGEEVKEVDIEQVLENAKKENDTQFLYELAVQVINRNKELEDENKYLSDNIEFGKTMMAIYNKVLQENGIDIPLGNAT